MAPWRVDGAAASHEPDAEEPVSTDDLLSRLEAQQRALHDTWDDTIRRAIAIADAGRTVPAQALDAIAAIEARLTALVSVIVAVEARKESP